MIAALVTTRGGRHRRRAGPLVLLVEPSRPLAEELAAALRRCGRTVEVVGYPLQVPGRAARRGPVGVLLLDAGPYCVPCLVRALRTVPALRRTPIILLPRYHADVPWVLREVNATLTRRTARADGVREVAR